MSGNVRFAVSDIVRRRAESEGMAGRDWLEAFDESIAGLERDWDISVGETLSGGTAAYVASATDAQGETFILKVATPGSFVGRHEVDVLTLAAGRGYVRLIRHDTARHAMLLEQLGPRLDQLDLTYRQQIDIMCATLLDAWRPVPTGGRYVNGEQKANALAQDMLRNWHELGAPCRQAVLDTALMYCRDRAAAWRPENSVLAHGDPHPANIMAVRDDPRHFRFIDPDGLAMEPAYDLGVLLRAWHEGIEGPHAHDIARSHARYLTSRTQVPAEAVWQWGYIERVSTGLHLMELGETTEGRKYLAVAEAVTI